MNEEAAQFQAMNSEFPDVNEMEEYEIQSEWGNGNIISLGISNKLLRYSWEQNYSKTSVNVFFLKIWILIFY